MMKEVQGYLEEGEGGRERGREGGRRGGREEGGEGGGRDTKIKSRGRGRIVAES